MKIIEFHAENIKKLKVVSIKPDGHVVHVTGPNGSGKSSVLDSIYYALAGSSHHPSKTVRVGEEKAIIKLNLGEIVVTRKFTAEGTTSLTVETPDGAAYKSPQTLLDTLLGELTFDPLTFMRLYPRDQAEVLKKIAGLEAELERIEGMLTQWGNLRSAKNQDLRKVTAELQAANSYPDLPLEEISVGELVSNLEVVGQQNQAAEKEHAKRREAEKELEDVVAQKGRYEKKIQELQAELRRFEALNDFAIGKIGELRSRLQSSSLPSMVDTAPIKQKISEAERTNKLIRENQRYAKLLENARVLRDEVAQQTEHLEKLKTKKLELISAAPMPIPGLSLSEAEVVYNGLPLAQASAAEQLRTSVAIAMALNPKLRVLRITDGSLLDQKNLRMLAEMAEEKDFQIWIEQVAEDGKLGIVMEEGEVIREPSSDRPTDTPDAAGGKRPSGN